MTVTHSGSQVTKWALTNNLNLDLHSVQRTRSLACLLPTVFSSFLERLKPSAFHHQAPGPHLTPGSPEAIDCGCIGLQGPRKVVRSVRVEA